MKLNISQDLSLPVDAVTATFCIVGIRGSGKSTTAVDMAEEMLKAKQQIVVLDPKDDWYGIRSSADGKSQGFPVTIFGGRHQDAPLEHTGGALLAELILKEQISAIISTKHLSDGHRFKFVYDFCDYTYKHCSEPMHLFMDEADQFAPQERQNKIQKGDSVSESMMLSLVRRVIKQGRTSGLGISLITQSPATLDKRVMNMCETLIAMRVIGAQDFDAVGRWFKVYLRKKDDLETIVSRLPTLRAGEGVFYSPAWLEVSKIVQFRLAETFDSRATPRVGKRRVEPKVLAPVDLERLSERMTATIERVKADDPRELRKEIARLKQVGKQQPERVVEAADPKVVRQLAEVKRALGEAMKFIVQITAADFTGDDIDEDAVKAAIGAAMGEIKKSIAGKLTARDAELQKLRKEGLAIVKKMGALAEDRPVEIAVTVQHNKPFTVNPTRREPRATTNNGDKPLPKGEKEILAALIQYPDGLERSQIGVLTGHTKRSTRDAYIYRLSTKGYVTAEQGRKVIVTQKGVDALPGAEPLPTGEALQNYWLTRLPGGEREILEFLIGQYPNAVDRETIGEQTGYEKRSTRDAYIYRLSQKQLVVTTTGAVSASENLFV